MYDSMFSLFFLSTKNELKLKEHLRSVLTLIQKVVLYTLMH